MSHCVFQGDTLNENTFEQFLRGLKNDSFGNKLFSQFNALTFDEAVEQSVALKNAKFVISELKI